MERYNLQDRLQGLEPTNLSIPPLLKDMTIQCYINALRGIFPECHEEVYRLLRCTDALPDMNRPLCEVIFDASGMNQETADRILYDLIIRPFSAIGGKE